MKDLPAILEQHYGKEYKYKQYYEARAWENLAADNNALLGLFYDTHGYLVGSFSIERRDINGFELAEIGKYIFDKGFLKRMHAKGLKNISGDAGSNVLKEIIDKSGFSEGYYSLGVTNHVESQKGVEAAGMKPLFILPQVLPVYVRMGDGTKKLESVDAVGHFYSSKVDLSNLKHKLLESYLDEQMPFSDENLMLSENGEVKKKYFFGAMPKYFNVYCEQKPFLNKVVFEKNNYDLNLQGMLTCSGQDLYLMLNGINGWSEDV